MRKITILLFFTAHIINAQQTGLKVFNHLIGSTWRAEGNWGDGSKFKQEVNFKYNLDSTIVIASSLGFTNREQTIFGPRNHGIRKLDPKTGQLLFWEFDVFGGLTKGTITAEHDNIYYTYNYNGTEVTDAWVKNGEDSYQFTVGVFKEGKWTNKFLNTYFYKVDKEGELKKLLDKLDAAVVSRDFEILDKHLSENLRFIAPNGMVVSKDIILRPFKNPNSKNNLSGILSDYKEINFSQNNAYVISETTHKFNQGKELKYRQVITLNKSSGIWKMEFVQSTLINN